jgi:cysteine synthase A
MNIRENLLECIGGTPLVRLSRFADGAGATLLAKLEMFNPYSVKDRPAYSMITEAERRGEITRNTTIVEASSGNTAIALAFICAVKGYRCTICMSEIQSAERRQVLRALGAELILTPKEKGTMGAREKVMELVEENPNTYYICQHSNPDNIRAHARTTAEELWKDTDGEIDVLVAALGTTGTAMGVAQVIKPRRADFRVVGVEPAEAPVLSEGRFRPHRMMGTAPGWVPDLYDPSLVDEIVTVSEKEAFEACRRLARTEGILAGITSGANALAALRVARREEMAGKTIVCMVCDSGERYLSVEDLYL